MCDLFETMVNADDFLARIALQREPWVTVTVLSLNITWTKDVTDSHHYHLVLLY
jgi:hypothetical protein